MIKVSDTARHQIAVLMGEEGFDFSKDFVRIGVKSGGCSGLAYELGFENSTVEGDKIFEDNNVRISVDHKSSLYLMGTLIDYEGGLNGKGFLIINPNAKRTCGCGDSFSV